MLLELHVKDLALVEDVWLRFDPGMTVLTGETGAGKTVLVEALKLLLGERADSTLVRSGAEEALVEGRFEADGAEIVVQRRVSADGRSRCTLDGTMATVGMLAERLGPLVDLHGQHDHQALLHPSNHRAYLDRSIGAEAERALAEYRTAFAAASAARTALAELEESLADRERQADFLRFQLNDIESAAPRTGEDDEIDALLPRLRHAERLMDAAATAHAALRDEEGAWEALGAAVAALSGASGLDPALDALHDDLVQAAAAVDDVGSRLRAYAESVEHDPRALDEAEARRAVLDTLKRKYGPTLGDVARVRDQAVERLAALDAGEEGLSASRERVAESERALRDAGGVLQGVRDAAVGGFESALQRAASELALPGAVFRVRREELPFEAWTADGPERVEFLFSASAGDEPKPLAKIASGGETSRVMLALKSVLGDADDVPVLAFDEVDAGIGGATALAVGERLASLAADRQVLVITHLAQVAAFADHQVVVHKAREGERSVTRVRVVDDEERVAEIARMLSGNASETGLAHARELLSQVAAR